MSDRPSPAAVRAGTEADADELVPLMVVLGYATTPEQMRTRMARIAAHPDYHTLVAERDGRVVGMVGVQWGIAWNNDAPWARVNSLAVLPEERGRGTGAALMAAAEAWAREQGATSIHLTTNARREGAHRFYERIGYQNTGRRYIRRL